MATSSGYDGGIGGKFRRRPLRRQAATPYDRPASAARGGPPRGLAAAAAAGGGNGWLSKLVDPASRFIAGSAARFFASLFRKRLTAPPAERETGGASDPIREEDTEVVSAQPLLEVEKGNATGLTNLPNSSGTNSISEFEQILKQKTLTRDEFERLTDILRSRIINSDPVTGNEIIGSASERNMDVPHAGKLTHMVVPADSLEDTRSCGDQSKPLMKLAIHEGEAASPAELAKAYMGSRTSQLPSSALSLRNHVFSEENKMPSLLGAKPLFSVGQRSILRAPASAADERHQDCYLTPRPLGRSAIFKMSRSPYFRSNASSNVKGRKHSRDDPSSPFQTPKAIAYSGGKDQLLKRGSSVFDSDLESFGPLRRTRQKFSQTSPVKGMPPVPAGKLPLMYNNDVNVDSTSVQKPLNMGELNYNGTDMQNSEREFSRADLSQSSKIAMKISQELDKFVPSPKEKSSNILSLGGSNVKSSYPLIERQSLSKFKDLDTSELKTFGSLGDSTTPGIKNSLAQKQQEATHNGSSAFGSGVKLPHQDFKHSGNVSLLDFVTSKSTLEVSEEANHDPVRRETSAAPLTLKERIGLKISLDKGVIPETATQEHCRIQSSTSMFSPVLNVSKMEEGRAFSRTISENDVDFCFPSTSVSNSFSIPPTPTMPSPLVQKTTAQKDKLVAPTFGAKGANDIAVSSKTTTVITSDAGQDSTRSFPKSSLAQVPMLDEVGETQTSRVVFKSFGNVDSTGKTEPSTPVFAFGVKADEGSSNGSLYSSSSLSFSAVGAVAVSGNIANLSSSCDSSLNSRSLVSSASASADVPIFKFGSDTVPQFLDKTNISPLEPAKASLVSTTNSNTGKDTMSTLAAFQLSSSSSFSTLTSVTVPSMGSSSFAQVESAVSSNICGNQSAKVPDLPSSTLSKSHTLFGTGSVFGTQNQSEGDVSRFSKNSANPFSSFSSSPSFGLDSSSSGFGGFQFGASSTDSKPFGSTVSSSGPCSSNSTTSFSFAPESCTTSANASNFQLSTSSFSSAFSPNAPTSSIAFSFPSTSASSSSPFVSSPGSLFSSTSSSSTAIGQSVSGRSSSVGFNSTSTGDDQMNVEDSMAIEDEVPLSTTPASGVPGNLLTTPVFGSPTVQSAAPVFKFGGNQNPLPPNPSPFQAASSGEYSAGGSFSLGSGGGDKSGRRIIRVRRDKLRKK